MFKVVLKCEKCEKKTASFEDTGVFEIDFAERTLTYRCIHCSHENVLNLGSIEAELKKHTGLPKISRL